MEASRDRSLTEYKASLNSQNTKTLTLMHLLHSTCSKLPELWRPSELHALFLQILPPLSGQRRQTRLTAFLALGLASEAKNGGSKL